MQLLQCLGLPLQTNALLTTIHMRRRWGGGRSERRRGGYHTGSPRICCRSETVPTNLLSARRLKLLSGCSTPNIRLIRSYFDVIGMHGIFAHPPSKNTLILRLCDSTLEHGVFPSNQSPVPQRRFPLCSTPQGALVAIRFPSLPCLRPLKCFYRSNKKHKQCAHSTRYRLPVPRSLPRRIW